MCRICDMPDAFFDRTDGIALTPREAAQAAFMTGLILGNHDSDSCEELRVTFCEFHASVFCGIHQGIAESIATKETSCLH